MPNFVGNGRSTRNFELCIGGKGEEGAKKVWASRVGASGKDAKKLANDIIFRNLVKQVI